jgi:hypothetical protein
MGLLDSAGPRRTPPIDLNALVSPVLGLTVVVLSVILVFTIVGLVLQNRRLTSLELRLLRLTRGSDDGNLQDVLEEHLDAVSRVVDDVDELAARSAMLEERSQRAFQRIGFVRFNPFEDTGSNQSFVLALLDGHGDGIVISSLHTRAATRMYAKTVSAGRSDGALSAEEVQALELARSPYAGRTPDGALDVRIATARPGSIAVELPEGPTSGGSRGAMDAPTMAGAPEAPVGSPAPMGGTSPR